MTISFVDPGFVDSGFVAENRSLVDLLSLPDINLNISVELQCIKRSDLSPKTFYFTRFLDSLLRRSRSDFLPFLRGTGGITQSLSEDLLVGGLAQETAGTILLQQDAPDLSGGAVDLLSQLLEYSFAGYLCTIKIGELSVDEYTSWPTFATFTIDQEPTFSLIATGTQVSIPLASISSRLANEQIQLTRNVGIPTCVEFDTAVSYASAPHIDAYAIQQYTIILRYSIPAAPTSAITFFSSSDGTHTTWSIILDTDGVLKSSASSLDAPSLPAIAYNLQSTGATAVGNGGGGSGSGGFFTIILAASSIDFFDSKAYLSINGVIVSSTTSLNGVIDIATSADVKFASRSSGIDNFRLFDVRIYNQYIEPDNAISASSSRFDETDSSCIGLWQFDDNNEASTQVTDYSLNANHATLHGTVNTDYRWAPTDQGEAGLAGSPQPFILGIPFNARAQLIDSFRSRFRVADSDAVDEVAGQSIAIRSRALPLTVTTDYTDQGNGVYQTASPEQEPITFDIVGGGSENYLPNRIGNTLLSRTRLTTSSINTEQLSALSYLTPWSIGYQLASDITASDFLSQVCASSGYNYYEDVDGGLLLDFFLPPIGLGPYGRPCLDFRGRRSNQIIVGNTGSITGSHTLVCWFYTHAVTPTENFSDALQTPPIGQFLINKGNNYSLSVDLEGGASGRINFSHLDGLSLGNLYGPSGLIKAGRWQFIAGVLDNTAKTRKIYYGQLGVSGLTLVSSDSGWTGSPTANSNILSIGSASLSSSRISSTWGSVSHAQVWSTALDESTLLSLMSTPPGAGARNLSIYVPGDEGQYNYTQEVISGSVCSIANSRWAPTLTIDLSKHPLINLVDFKHIVPASKIVIRYGKNWTPLTDADIATTADLNARINHKRQWKEVSSGRLASSSNPTGKTRTIILETCLTSRQDALRLLQFLQYRFSSNRYIMTLDFPSPKPGDPSDWLIRRVLASIIGDEVLIYSDIPHELAGGIVFKVVGLTRDPFAQSTRMILVG